MDHFIRHPAHADPVGSAHSWSRMASRLATWVWPPIETSAPARPDPADATPSPDPEAPAWSARTMHWVPLVVPLAAVLMLLMAVLVGSRL